MKRTEHGQVLVIIILSAIVLFGFAALAVDGGRLYAEKRRAQNAADASALAAAYAFLDGKTWTTAAMGQVRENGFDDSDPAVNDTARVDVHIHNPPISGPYIGNKEYFQVFIREEVDKVFAQIVYQGPWTVNVEAVARARNVTAIFPGQALVSVNSKECEAMLFSGGGTTKIRGGSVFSNSNGTAKNGGCYGMQSNGSGSVTVYDGGLYVVGGYNEVGSGPVSPNPLAGMAPLDVPFMKVPDCSNLDVKGNFANHGANSEETIGPGRYSKIFINGGTVHMSPGMYCLSGEFTVGGGANLDGFGVMIVMLDGDLNFQGGGKIDLTYAESIKDGSGEEWGGMLIYMPTANDGLVNIGGGASSNYTGTILAPGTTSNNSPKCDVFGNTGTIGLNSAVICNTVSIHGDASFDITYEEKKNYRMPPTVDLSQ